MRRWLIVMVGFAALGLHAGGNLLPNGSFDEGERYPEHWERADGLTSFFEQEEGRGWVVKLDTLVDRVQAMEWAKAFRENPELKAPVKKPIAAGSYGSIGGNEGVMLDSVMIDCEPGQDYRLRVDFRGEGKPFVWIKGFLWHPTREMWADGYQTRLEPSPVSATEWRTYEIGFNPTAKSPRIRKMKVRLYAYWPNGVYWFDNVKIDAISKEEMARLTALRESGETQVKTAP